MYNSLVLMTFALNIAERTKNNRGPRPLSNFLEYNKNINLAYDNKTVKKKTPEYTDYPIIESIDDNGRISSYLGESLICKENNIDIFAREEKDASEAYVCIINTNNIIASTSELSATTMIIVKDGMTYIAPRK